MGHQGLEWLGVALTLMGAASLALGMVLQRYALSFPEERVPLFGVRWPRLLVWFLGLVVYGVANAFYAMALPMGPFSLLAAVFTTLLIFNMIFARLLLREELTIPKVGGSLTILVGVCLCLVSSPADVQTEFTPEQVAELASSPQGSFFIVALLCVVLAAVISILVFERKYPAAAAISTTASEVLRQTSDSDAGLQQANAAGTAIDTAHAASSGAKETLDEVLRESQRAPSAWLNGCMAFIYPGSLGLDEAICHTAMKASLAMLASGDDINHWIFYTSVSLWVISAFATVWWMKVVFARYETTTALPVEYGLVNAGSVCSGLLFYREHKFMELWQLALTVVGIVLILLGISCGPLAALPSSTRSALRGSSGKDSHKEVSVGDSCASTVSGSGRQGEGQPQRIEKDNKNNNYNNSSNNNNYNNNNCSSDSCASMFYGGGGTDDKGLHGRCIDINSLSINTNGSEDSLSTATVASA
ncbi:unnamed protein product [Polarella glacialis]|uniref:Uncharacterized protein n=2 Tax=Polarella glacialis TaxID=89957 RepID=A0A813LES8_POLGL|nr:unnamed protein product [Polarella glacialis]